MIIRILLAAAAVSSSEAKMSLPELECPTYDNVTMAEAACQGDFLMWGQFFDNSTGIQQKRSAFVVGNVTNEAIARVGPYYCSKCNEENEGYGYVGTLETLPSVVSTCGSTQTWKDVFTTEECTPGLCEKVKANSLDGMTCAALQLHCETTNNGWLVFAKSFAKSDGGEVACSGGCDSIYEDGNHYFQASIDGPDDDMDYFALPMLTLFSLIIVVTAAAIYIDFRRYQGNDNENEWFSPFMLNVLGYVDIEGKKTTCMAQLLVNPCPCFGGLCYGGFLSRWTAFLSVFVLTLGVAVAFGDAAKFEHICYFNALAETVEKSTYTDFFPRVFLEGFSGGTEEYEAYPELEIFDIPWFLSETSVVLFQKSQDLLARNLVRGGYMTEKATLLMMMGISSLFLLVCLASTWRQVDIELLFINWMAGFIVAIILFTPFFTALSYALAKALVICGCLREPPAETTREDEKASDTEEQNNPGVAAELTDSDIEVSIADQALVWHGVNCDR